MIQFHLVSGIADVYERPSQRGLGVILSMLVMLLYWYFQTDMACAQELLPFSSMLSQEKAASNSHSADERDSESDPLPRPVSPDGADASHLEVNPITGVGSVSAVNYQPLTPSERMHLYFKQNFTTVGAYLGTFVGSLIDQIEDQPPEWGGGMTGYGERLASRFGSGVIQGSIQASVCAVIGQDPRYIRSGSESPWRRTGHAFLFSILTYNNEGEKRLAFGTLGSYYLSSMIATSWLPSRYTPLGDGVRDGNRQVIMASFTNLVQEFWPEIRKTIHRR